MIAERVVYVLVKKSCIFISDRTLITDFVEWSGLVLVIFLFELLKDIFGAWCYFSRKVTMFSFKVLEKSWI